MQHSLEKKSLIIIRTRRSLSQPARQPQVDDYPRCPPMSSVRSAAQLCPSRPPTDTLVRTTTRDKPSRERTHGGRQPRLDVPALDRARVRPNVPTRDRRVPRHLFVALARVGREPDRPTRRERDPSQRVHGRDEVGEGAHARTTGRARARVPVGPESDQSDRSGRQVRL